MSNTYQISTFYGRARNQLFLAYRFYCAAGGARHTKHCDHNTTYIELSVKIPKIVSPRTELFNFKNKVCQETFFEVTNISTKLSECFTSNDCIQEQGKKWFKNINNLFQQSFRKIRVTSKSKETTVSKFI